MTCDTACRKKLTQLTPARCLQDQPTVLTVCLTAAAAADGGHGCTHVLAPAQLLPAAEADSKLLCAAAASYLQHLLL
jgi:hypothetical protein